MAGRRRAGLTVSGLSTAYAGQADPEHGPRIVARFLSITGMAATANREVHVAVTMPELAELIGSVPALQFEDPADFAVMMKAIKILKRNGRAAEPQP